MANKNIRTNVIVSAEAKGFDTVQQKSAKVSAEAAKGMAQQVKGFKDAEKGSVTFHKSLEKLNKMSFKDVQKQIGGLKDNLSELKKTQFAVTDAMSGVDGKAGPAYSKLKERLKQVRDESKQTESQISSLTSAFAKQAQESEKAARIAEQRKGAFVQGMAQGGLPMPAPFLQRGPGMGRQMAGMAVGMGARGAMRGASALGSATFGGVQGMAQGLGAIPLVGGVIAGQFQQSIGYAQQNIGWQRSRLANAPYMESMDDFKRRRSISAESVSAVKRREASEGDVSALIARASYLEERANMVEKIKKGESVGGSEVLNMVQREVKTREPVSQYMESTGRRSLRNLSRRDITRDDPGLLRLQASELDKEIASALSSQRKAVSEEKKAISKGSGMRDPMAGVAGMGVNLMGVSMTEAEQMAASIAQAGGGYVGGARQQELIGQGFAAKTAFGIGADTTGAFFGASRRGGLTGTGGGNGFKDAIAEGLEMGLSRSEVNKWMQMTAQGISQFETTGIPINTGSISDLAGNISGAGLTGTRALSMARGITGGLQGIGSRGMQSGTDMMMLQLVGGYKGGGASEYRAARSRLEELNMGGQGVDAIAGNSKIANALKRVMGLAGGDRGSQAELLQQVVTKLGGRGSVKEFDWLQRSLSGGEATPEQFAAIQQEKAMRAAGAGRAAGIRKKGGLKDLASGMVGTYSPGARAMAGLENQQIDAGGKVVGRVISLEQASINTAKAFENLAGKHIDTLTASLGALSDEALRQVEIYKGGAGFFGGDTN